MHSPGDKAYSAIYEVKENMYGTAFISLSFYFSCFLNTGNRPKKILFYKHKCEAIIGRKLV